MVVTLPLKCIQNPTTFQCFAPQTLSDQPPVSHLNYCNSFKNVLRLSSWVSSYSRQMPLVRCKSNHLFRAHQWLLFATGIKSSPHTDLKILNDQASGCSQGSNHRYHIVLPPVGPGHSLSRHLPGFFPPGSHMLHYIPLFCSKFIFLKGFS